MAPGNRKRSFPGIPNRCRRPSKQPMWRSASVSTAPTPARSLSSRALQVGAPSRQTCYPATASRSSCRSSFRCAGQDGSYLAELLLSKDYDVCSPPHTRTGVDHPKAPRVSLGPRHHPAFFLIQYRKNRKPLPGDSRRPSPCLLSPYTCIVVRRVAEVTVFLA